MSRSRLCRACGKWHDLDEAWPQECAGHFAKATGQGGLQVIKDIEPYRSMVDGSWITSRRHHRDHLRAHRMIEVGNDTKPLFERPKLKAPPGLGREIARVYDQLSNR